MLEERRDGLVIRQFDGSRAAQRGGQRPPGGDGVGGEGGTPPRQAAEAARLHQECPLALPVQRGHHRLAVTVVPDPADPVQRDAVPQQDGVGRLRPRQPMAEVAPALPQVGQGRGETAGRARKERGCDRGRVARVRPEHVQEQVHPHRRPEIHIAAPPAPDLEPLLDRLGQLQIALLD